FQPADIVSQILNFGTPAPIDVSLIGGTDAYAVYEVGQRLGASLKRVPGTADVHVHQTFDLPTLALDVDRTRAQAIGLSARDVAQNVLVSLSSSFQTAPTFWLDPKNGVSYSVAVQTPQYRMDSFQALQNTPISGTVPGAAPQILGNLVHTTTTARPATISHFNAQPMINVYAAVDGRDLGGVSDEVAKQVKEIEKDLP